MSARTGVCPPFRIFRCGRLLRAVCCGVSSGNTKLRSAFPRRLPSRVATTVLRARTLREWRFQCRPDMDLKASMECKCLGDILADMLCWPSDGCCSGSLQNANGSAVVPRLSLFACPMHQLAAVKVRMPCRCARTGSMASITLAALWASRGHRFFFLDQLHAKLTKVSKTAPHMPHIAYKV
jgi:hypothetical protein